MLKNKKSKILFFLNRINLNYSLTVKTTIQLKFLPLYFAIFAENQYYEQDKINHQ